MAPTAKVCCPANVTVLDPTVPVFSNHNATVRAQRTAQLKAHPLGALVAGHQKDVVFSARLAAAPGKVAIYGWHQTNGAPIQPLYLGHTAAWVDYSQCTRLVQQKMLVNGQPKTVAEVLADPALSGLLSDEGVIPDPRYPTNALQALSVETNAVDRSSVKDGKPNRTAERLPPLLPLPFPRGEGRGEGFRPGMDIR